MKARKILARIKRMERRVMTVLEDLQGGVTDLDASVVDLLAEDATMLTDFGAKIDALTAELAAGNTVDPNALSAITADMHARAADIRTVIANDTTADPGPPVDGSPHAPVSGFAAPLVTGDTPGQDADAAAHRAAQDAANGGTNADGTPVV